jgi:hypothetical protein
LDRKKKEGTVSSSDLDSLDSNSESDRSSISSISSNISPLLERLFKKGNSPAVSRNVGTRVPDKKFEEKKKMTVLHRTMIPKTADE